MCAHESSLHTYRTKNGYRITNITIYKKRRKEEREKEKKKKRKRKEMEKFLNLEKNLG
jgi:hypothetical protein